MEEMKQNIGINEKDKEHVGNNEENKEEIYRTNEEEEMDLDQILSSIGLGPWHLLIFFINILIWAVHGPHTMGSTIFNAPVDFLCFSSSDTACNFLRSTEMNNATFEYDSNCIENQIRSSKYERGEIDCNFLSSEKRRIKFTDDGSCSVVLYDTSMYSDTVTTDWNLICDSSMKRPLFQNIYSLGIIVGCFLVGPISDSVGRARAIFIGSIIHIFSSLLVVLVPFYSISLAARFLVGISNVLVLISAVTYAVENCPVAWRGPVGTCVGLPYSIWIVVFAAVAFYVRNWYHLYIAVTFPAAFLLPAAMALDESPRWLLQQGREKEAYDILLNAAVKNKASKETKQLIIHLREESYQHNAYEFGGNSLPLTEKVVHVSRHSRIDSLELSMLAPSGVRPAQFEISIDSSEAKYISNADDSGDSLEEKFYATSNWKASSISNVAEKALSSESCNEMNKDSGKLKNCATKSIILLGKIKGEVVPFFRTPFMRRITLVSFISKFFCELVYYGIFFNTNNFASDNPFLYVGLSGIADATAVLVGVVSSKTLTRKLSIGGGFVTAGIFLLIVLTIPKDFLVLQWIFVLSGFLMTAVASQIFYVYIPELFPTSLRGKGFALCNLAGNIGILIAPLVSDVLGEKVWWGPGVFLGCSGLIAGLLVLFLPETKDRKLCETVADIERREYGKLN